jgi:carboxyvinyl-carboxyphosphonate phosphorylmutase
LKYPEYLASRNVRVLLTGHQPIAAAMNAAFETLLALRNGVKASDLPGLPSKDRIAVALDEDRYSDHIRDFLNG